jgi:hypothetical protein
MGNRVNMIYIQTIDSTGINDMETGESDVKDAPRQKCNNGLTRYKY